MKQTKEYGIAGVDQAKTDALRNAPVEAKSNGENAQKFLPARSVLASAIGGKQLHGEKSTPGGKLQSPYCRVWAASAVLV